MFNKNLEKLKLSKLEFVIVMSTITIITFLSAFHFLPTYNLKLYLMSNVVILLVIASYLDIKFKSVENLVLFPAIIILLLLTTININNNNIGLLNIITIGTIIYIYFYHKRKDNLNEIGGADVKILIPMILSLNYIELIMFIMLIGDILFTITILKGLKKWSIPFFSIITLPYFIILILNNILNNITW